MTVNLFYSEDQMSTLHIIISMSPRQPRTSEQATLLPSPQRDVDSLEDGDRPGVDALADLVVGREGQDPRPAAGPDGPAFQRMHRLAQAHDRRVDVSHGDGLHRLAVFLLEGGAGEGNRGSGPLTCVAFTVSHIYKCRRKQREQDFVNKHWILYLP